MEAGAETVEKEREGCNSSRKPCRITNREWTANNPKSLLTKLRTPWQQPQQPKT
jgi:hypothetical protein